MSVEEAKLGLLNPPPKPVSPPFLQASAPWFVMGAFVVGFFVGSPRRINRLLGLIFRVLTSPMARKALFPVIMNAAQRARR